MKKKLTYVLFFTIALLLLGCASEASAHSGNAITLYYMDAVSSYGTADGALGSELYTFEDSIPTYTEFLDLYFNARKDATLVSPFPSGLQCLDTSLDDGILTVILSDEFDTLSGIDHSIATACITKTLMQFESVTGVCLETGQNMVDGTEVGVLTDKDYVLQDLGAINTETTVMLYFSDTNGRYLVQSERKSYFSDAELIPAYIMQQLIDGPSEDGQIAVMPEGTSLRGISVDEDGNCVVNLSSEFLFNKPNTVLMERMTILSIVNSLTELEAIETVRFLVEGEPVIHYLFLDLSIAYQRDEQAIGVVRAGLNETDATIYVQCWSDIYLTPVPVCIRNNSQTSLADVLLQKLISFKDLNGMENPMPEGTAVLSVEQQGEICYVDFSRGFLHCAGDETRERMAIRAITSTLTSIDGISYVKISINQDYEGLTYFDLNRLFEPSDEWYY